MPTGLYQKNPAPFLFAVILTEGYIVLSSELLAIRLSIPFVGSGTDTVSIIIAAVLLPLAFGYYAGGHFYPRRTFRSYKNVRSKLVSNLLMAFAFLLPGLSHVFLDAFFKGLTAVVTTDLRLQTAIYASLFIATPVYLLGQTIPLVSNYFPEHMLPRTTGRILFFSTLGSFAGATASTLVLMSFVGVHYTVTLNFILLFGLIWTLGKDKRSPSVACALVFLIIGASFNSGAMMKTLGIVGNNTYNTISVLGNDWERHLVLNGNYSSKYTDDRRKYKHIEFIERMAIDPIWNGETPRDILIIGAGAFTIGHEDHTNHYDFVDIDKSLKDIAERYVLKEKIPANHTFHARPARAFLNETRKRYDVIVLDAYSGHATIPEDLMTVEFFRQVREHLKENGIVAANVAISPNFNTPISRHFDNTFRSVFPYVSRYVVDDLYSLWEKREGIIANVIYLYTHHPDERTDIIYSDLKNRVYFDKSGQ